MEDWERDHCLWLAKAEGAIDYPKQARVCSVLANREVTVKEVKRLRDKRAWRTLYTKIRHDRKALVAEARNIIDETLKPAAQLGKRAIEEQLSSKEMDTRIVPQLIKPYLEITAPKKREQSGVPTTVNINLTVGQVQHLDSPSYEVEAEEVDAEIVP